MRGLLERAGAPPALLHLAAVLLVIGVGVWLRLLGIFTIELWADEAEWANKLVEGKIGWIRPAGYMWLTRALLLLHNSEAVLRSLSTLAGIAQLPLMFLLLRRLVTPWVALAGTFVLAVHPMAIGMSKEFKPYALESCLHTLLLLLAVAYLAMPRTRTMIAIAIVSALTPPFAWSPVFLFPGLFVAVGVVALRMKNRRDVLWAVGGVVATLLVLAGIFAARLKDANPHPEFWGNRYGVFFLGHGVGPALSWYVEKTAELLALPSRLRFWFGFDRTPLQVATMMLCVVGVAGLFARRRFGWALLFVLTWIVFLLFNVAGQWPYGLFRTNVFVLTYALPLAALGVDEVHRAFVRLRPQAGVALAVVCFTALAAAWPAHPSWFARKQKGTLTTEASVLRAMRTLRKTEPAPREKLTVAFDGQACSIFTYYRDNHTAARAELHDWFTTHVDARCSRGRDAGYQKMLGEMVARDESFWIIVAKKSTMRHTKRVLTRSCTASVTKNMPITLLAWCGRGEAAPPEIPRQ